MTIAQTLLPPKQKLSKMASIRNGEIPVILVFVRDQVPQNYKLVAPDEAEKVLSLIEFMRDHCYTPCIATQPAAGSPESEGRLAQ